MGKRTKDRMIFITAVFFLMVGVCGLIVGGTGIITASAETEDPIVTAEATTFSAILASPASTGNVVSDPVDINSATFAFTFEEAVKNNVLNTADAVVLVKTSDSTIVATAMKDTGKISFTDMGSNGSISTTFTIDPTVLALSTEYQLQLDGAIASVTGKTLGSDVVYTFTTASDTVIPPGPAFEAITLYPVMNAKDVSIDASLEIGFTEAIKINNKIASGQAIQLIASPSEEIIPATYTVSSDQTAITIDPVDSLEYGQNYILKILDAQIKTADGTEALSEQQIPFRTTSFSQVSASALMNGNGATVTVQLNNEAASNQNAFLEYVVRRDKGARMESGGTVVLSSKTAQIACTAKAETPFVIELSDVSVDQYGNAVAGDVYLDIYVVNNSGNLLYSPIHIIAE